MRLIAGAIPGFLVQVAPTPREGTNPEKPYQIKKNVPRGGALGSATGP